MAQGGAQGSQVMTNSQHRVTCTEFAYRVGAGGGGGGLAATRKSLRTVLVYLLYLVFFILYMV